MTHKLTYTHSKSEVSTTIEVHEDANVSALLEAFEVYLKACQFNLFNKHLELVDDENL